MMQMSTGGGKAKVLDDTEMTVYQRALDQNGAARLRSALTGLHRC